jgi:hypothetical protein
MQWVGFKAETRMQRFKFLGVFLVFLIFAILVTMGNGQSRASNSERDLTGSGLEIELLDFQAACVGSCPHSDDVFQTMDFIDAVAVLRISNRSEKNPKHVQPCNISMSVGSTDGLQDFNRWWMLFSELGSEASNIWEEPDQYDKRRTICTWGGDKPEPSVSRDNSIVILLGSSFRYRAIPNSVAISFGYSGDDEFVIRTFANLTEGNLRSPRIKEDDANQATETPTPHLPGLRTSQVFSQIERYVVIDDYLHCARFVDGPVRD